MSVLDEASIQKELGAVKIQTFSSELEALQFCRDDDALYEQLIRSAEKEPFLLARLVKVANSVVYGGNADTFIASPSECLMRIGLTTGQQIALDFLINKSIGRITQANDLARATWNEALVAGRLSRYLADECEAPFDMGGPFLPVVLSYLGEVFVMSMLAEDETDVPDLGHYARSSGETFDVFGLSVTIMERLGLPKPVEEAVKQSHLLLVQMEPAQMRSAAALVLSRYIAQKTRPSNVHSSLISDELRDTAFSVLNIGIDDIEHLQQQVEQLRAA